MAKNNYNFQWHCYLRCQYVDKETVQLMKETGCKSVFLGLESGNDQVLKNMNKKTSTGQYLKGIELLRNQGIITFGSFIVGFPGETDETVQETLGFIKKSQLDFYRCQLWYCEPITPIWKQKEHYGLSGKSFEWSHRTMNSKAACDFIDEIFLSIDTPLFIPQYNFDINGVWHLHRRGMTLKEIKAFLTAFNKGIREKLENPGHRDAGTGVIEKLKACWPTASNNKHSMNKEQQPRHRLDINFNF